MLFRSKPDYPEAITNRANIAFQQGRYDDAQADFTRALELQPEMAEANLGRGLASLTQGDWETGFRLYEYRGKLKEPTFKPLPYPRWDGKVESGEEVVLVTEQPKTQCVARKRLNAALGEVSGLAGARQAHQQDQAGTVH